ncbi:MAG: TrkA family potassium uptake protein [Clostridia bacterium]
MKSILIIGMGRFGRHLANKMTELGNDVMIVDKEESIVNELAPHFTNAFIGDCTNEGVLRGLGVSNFDLCFVAIGDNFQASLEITSLLKELGAKYVVSKADRDMQAKFLAKNGADEVVYPEHDMAEKLAIRHNAKNIFDFIELNNSYAIYEIAVVQEWVGHSLMELNIRKKYFINILAIKRENNIQPLPDANYVFKKEDHVIVIGKPDDVFKLSNRK